MNNKVKLGWLEYFLELLPMLDSACFKDSTGKLHTHINKQQSMFTVILIFMQIFVRLCPSCWL